MKTLVLRFLFGAFVASVLSVSAVAQTAAGVIKAVKVQGSVLKISNGQSVPLTEGARLTENDSVTTQKNSSVVLVFMNGSSIKLGQDSTLNITEFKMDPLADEIKVADLENEPSFSKTELSLTRGELVGQVKHLNQAKSSYTIKTPVGAAGIRGTTFQIVYRPTDDGKAFHFELSTAEGKVAFSGERQSGEASMVEANKAIVVTAEVDDKTGQITSIKVESVQAISETVKAAITDTVASVISDAQKSTTFTTTEQQQGGSNTNNSDSSSNNSSGDNTKKDDTKKTDDTSNTTTDTSKGAGTTGSGGTTGSSGNLTPSTGL